jgi:uncharacterized protein YecE (DUF72 family)
VQNLLDSPRVSVGVGGWAYFPVRQNKLALCSKVFDFVEVNSTFYKLPPVKLASRWRGTVPEEFQFSMRASGKLTHEKHLEPIEENFREYEKNLTIGRVLQAFVLHFQFPPSFEVDRKVVNNWKNFFSSARKERGLNLAIEVRNSSSANENYLNSFFEDYDIVPTSDISKNEVRTSRHSKILYSRIFGLGEHTKWSFSTNELGGLKEKLEKVSAQRKYVTFHNITMYEDAARLKNLINEGVDLVPERPVGRESLKQGIISARIAFPVSYKELLTELSWRVITAENGRRIRADEAISRLPEEFKFNSLDEILKSYVVI